MHPDLEQLVPLQEMDIAAQHLREAIAAAPKRISEGTAQVVGATTRLGALREQIAKEEALRRRLESDTADQRQKVERAQKKLDAASTAVQVTALEHEIAFARAEISRLEDTELESMERSEILDAKLPPAEAELVAAQQTLDHVRLQSSETVAKSRSQVAELDQKREALRATILSSETGEASLSRYDRIAKARGTAISEALLGKCTACGMMVRPQLWQDLRDNSADSPSRTDLFTCENCGRILYYDPARDAPQRKPVQGESIAASIVRSL
jgi:predicted  nucleic acid-binding Zn-ribbon protein